MLEAERDRSGYHHRAGKDRELPSLDTVKPITLRNNRWRCDHGWDIDLDDGSTNYRIINNLCLNGGLKLREGFYRTVENNIMVNNSFHPHVWFRGSEDIFRRNIVFATYRPIEMKMPWGKECDFNWLHVGGWRSPVPARDLMKQSGRDAHSIVGDAYFNVAFGGAETTRRPCGWGSGTSRWTSSALQKPAA